MNNKLCIAFLVCGLLIYNVWQYFGAAFFYGGLHVLFIIAGVAFFRSTDGFYRRIAVVVIATNISSLLDDVFGWQRAGWNEYIILIAAFLITYNKHVSNVLGMAKASRRTNRPIN